MSKEATGQSGAKIGSSEYWSRANHTTMLGGLMGSKTSYQATIGQLGTKAAAAIEEIYEDLSALGSKIRYLPSSDRNALAKQVEGLYDICKMGGVSARHNSECVQGLNLSIMSPWTSSFRDERGIEKAISFIDKSRFSGSEAMKLLQEASKWSISFAAGGNKEKQAFLETAAQGNLSSRFLKDVADEYQNRHTTQRYEGRCGYSVGSKAYMTHLESKVFGAGLPMLICAASGNPDYEKLIKDALNSVADQLGRDLDNAIRENDYITDETADKLKAVVSELDHCEASTGGLSGKIEKLAWFVGGDPAKIKELQKALNELGVGQHLKEDGVYGEKTKLAGDKLIDNISELLTDSDKVRSLSKCIDLYLFLKDSSSAFQTQYWALRQALKVAMPVLERTVWKWGAEHYLRPRGYTVAALLLEHSLNKSPGNLYFPESHWVTQKIMKSQCFETTFSNMIKIIQEFSGTYEVSGSVDLDFQDYGDTDLYYGIGKCSLKYACTKSPTTVQISFTIDDEYNFDHIRSFRGDAEHYIATEFELGNLANDAGLISQADGVISVYHSHISFKQTIELN